LQRLYFRVHIPDGMWDELNARGQPWPGHDEVAGADWIERHILQDQALIRALGRDLDRGEAESIALALEIGADLVLMDESEGRHAAQRLGIHVIEVVGVLLEAKAQRVIDTVRPHLNALRQTAGFT